MAKITLNGVDALTESGGVVTIPGAANLVLGTDSVPSAAIQADAVTGAKIENNPTIAGNLTVSGLSTLTGNTTVMGDLTVQGSSIVTVSETLQIEDKNIELGYLFEEIQLEDATGYVLLEDGNGNIITESVVAITDATADGGGITLKGATDKTITWVNATDTWDFNQGIKITGASTFTGAVGVTGDITGQNIETSTTTKVKQKGAFMQSSTHQAMVLGG